MSGRAPRRPEGPPPPPTVMRVRLRYTKRGRLRFTSHRDFARAFERALRRAEAPMAYSAGFSPHPKISYIGAAPTGTASEAEYVEIGLVRRVDVEALRRALDEALPPGIDVLEAVEAAPAGSLADRVEASVWSVRLPGVGLEELRGAVDAFLAAAEVPVEKRTKSGRRTVDCRAAVVHLAALPDGATDAPRSDGPSGEPRSVPCAILAVVVRHTTPAVRPDDVLAGLRAVADLAPPAPPEATRCAQGLLRGNGELADPLEPDREAAPPTGERPAGPQQADVGAPVGS